MFDVSGGQHANCRRTRLSRGQAGKVWSYRRTPMAPMQRRGVASCKILACPMLHCSVSNVTRAQSTWPSRFLADVVHRLIVSPCTISPRSAPAYEGGDCIGISPKSLRARATYIARERAADGRKKFGYVNKLHSDKPLLCVARTGHASGCILMKHFAYSD